MITVYDEENNCFHRGNTEAEIRAMESKAKRIRQNSIDFVFLFMNPESIADVN